MTKKARKPRRKGGVAADYLERQKESLKRRHRQVIYLNDLELAALNEYCQKFKIESRSAVFRKATMEQILKIMDENHPTLF